MSAIDKVRIRCPKCHQRLAVPANLAGKRVRCPDKACATLIGVPAPSQAVEVTQLRPAARNCQRCGHARMANEMFCVACSYPYWKPVAAAASVLAVLLAVAVAGGLFIESPFWHGFVLWVLGGALGLFLLGTLLIAAVETLAGKDAIYTAPIRTESEESPTGAGASSAIANLATVLNQATPEQAEGLGSTLNEANTEPIQQIAERQKKGAQASEGRAGTPVRERSARANAPPRTPRHAMRPFGIALSSLWIALLIWTIVNDGEIAWRHAGILLGGLAVIWVVCVAIGTGTIEPPGKNVPAVTQSNRQRTWTAGFVCFSVGLLVSCGFACGFGTRESLVWNKHAEKYTALANLQRGEQTAIRGKILPIYKNDKSRYLPVYRNLPDEIRPLTPEEVRTVAWLDWQKSQVIVYNNGTRGYRHRCQVTVIDALSQTVIAERTFLGGPCPERVSGFRARFDTAGPQVDEQEILDFLVKLPRAGAVTTGESEP